MSRVVANSLLCLLLFATFQWGGCVACPQFFMFSKAGTDCCKAGQCEQSNSPQTAPKACNRMPLHTTGSFEIHADFSTAVLIASDFKLTGLMGCSALFTLHPLSADPSPPPLHVLNATFLI